MQVEADCGAKFAGADQEPCHLANQRAQLAGGQCLVYLTPYLGTAEEVIYFMITDPHPAFHFYADPDSAYHFNLDLDPAFHFNADPDLACHLSFANLRPLVQSPSRTPFLASSPQW